MKTEIRAMILSAGFGIRMQKAGDQTPKPLVRVRGRPLIHYPLLLLSRAGFQEVIINLHHRGEEIQSEIGESALGMKIHYLSEPEILGTGGGIKNAHRHFPSRLWLTLNADTIIDLDLKDLIAFHQKHHPLATMVLTRSKLGEFNTVFADSKDLIRKIGSRPETRDLSLTLSAFNYCGAQLIRSELLDYLPEGRSKIIEHGYLKVLEKEQVLGYIFNGLWIPIDTPEAKTQAEKELIASAPQFLKF